MYTQFLYKKLFKGLSLILISSKFLDSNCKNGYIGPQCSWPKFLMEKTECTLQSHSIHFVPMHWIFTLFFWPFRGDKQKHLDMIWGGKVIVFLTDQAIYISGEYFWRNIYTRLYKFSQSRLWIFLKLPLPLFVLLLSRKEIVGCPGYSCWCRLLKLPLQSEKSTINIHYSTLYCVYHLF